MTDWTGRQVIQGFAEDVLDRMPEGGPRRPGPADWGSRDPAKAAYWGQRTSAFHGVVSWAPTLDPERLKVISQEMLLEAGVRLVFHGWAARADRRGRRGQGRDLREQVRPPGADGQGGGRRHRRRRHVRPRRRRLRHRHRGRRRPPRDEHRLHAGRRGHGRAGWSSAAASRSSSPSSCAGPRAGCGFFQPPYVSWRNDIALFLGPRQSGLSALDVDDMTEVEIRSHRFMQSHCEFFRANAPGFEKAYMMQSAPQLGVRHTRRLARRRPDRAQPMGRRRPAADEVGVSPSVSPKFPVIGALWRAGAAQPGWPARLPAATSPATPIPTASCARSRNAG